jgi:NAD(P)H dehydrogenase (quinone)
VFVNGYVYDYPGTPPWTGPPIEKRALAVFTSSYDPEDFGSGRVGSLLAILHPLLWGTLAYTGMQVLEPFVAYAADSVDDDTPAGSLGSLGSLERRLGTVEGEHPLVLGPILDR